MKHSKLKNNNNSANKLTRLFVYLINKLWLTIATIIILIALVFALLRIFLPQINYFKSDIESWIENKYQVDINISSIDASWQSSGPVLSAKNFQLNSNDESLSLVNIENFSIHFDLFKSLLTHSVVTEKIDVYGAHLNFVLDRKLGIRLDTIEDSKQQQVNIDDASQLLLSSFFAQKKLSLNKSTISLVTLSHEKFEYSIDDFSIRNFGDIHQLTGELIDEHHGKINIVAEINGDPSLKENTAKVYLEATDIQINTLPLFDNLTHLKPAKGSLNWRMWADWSDGHWQSAVGNLEIDDVLWQKILVNKTPVANQNKQQNQITDVTDIADIAHFISQFEWRFEGAKKGTFSLYDVNLIRNNQENVKLPNLYFLFEQSENFDLHWDLITHDFQIKSLIEYLDVMFPNEENDTNLFEYSKLAIKLNSLGIRFNKKNGVWYLPEITTSFSDLSYQQLFNLPQLNGLSGQVGFANGQGRAQLLGENIQADFQQLFRNKINLDLLAIDLSWSLTEQDTIDIIFDKINIQNSDLSLNAKSHFYFQDDKAILSLYTELTDVDVSKKSNYLPTGVMSEGLTDYLDQSIKSGRLSIVKSVLHGPLEKFPFVGQEGLFSILAQLNDAEFQFLPDWPMANSLDVELAFVGNGMDLKASKGSSENNQINYARAVIKDFGLENTPLELNLNVSSRDNSGRNFLEQSPLKSIGESLSLLDYSGYLTTELNLVVGLDDATHFNLQGKVKPDKTSSKINIVGMQLNNIDGVVNFDQNGVKKSNLSAKYYGLPIKAKLLGADSGKQLDLLIDVDGQLSAKSLQDFVGENWSGYAKGKSKFKAQIQVGNVDHQGHTLVNFDSDLKGMEINLPNEFYKTADKEQALHLNLSIGDISTANIQWQDLKGQWQWIKEKENIQTLAGVFQYKVEQPLPKIKANRFVVDANLDELELTSWLPVYDSGYQDYLKSTSSLLNKVDINLNINRIILNDIELNQLKLNIDKTQNNTWLFAFNNSNVLGNLEMISNQPWKLQLDKLTYNPVEKQQEISIEESNNEIISEQPNIQKSYFEIPQNWPELDFLCNSCEVFNKHLGLIKANIRTTKDGLNIKANINDEKRHQLDFNLNWLQIDEAISQEKLSSEQSIADLPKSKLKDISHIEYSLNSNDIGKLMERWQYPVGVEDSSGWVTGKIGWLNNPWSPELASLQASAHFEIGKGNLSDVSDAKARLFSLFNLQSLGRRLTLDFKDIFKKGFFYDKINGDAVLKDQIASTNNIFIDGNAAKVDLVGEVDLEREIIEQTAIVTPQITSSLPVLVGWAVEPTTGILMYLLNKIMEPAIDVVTQVEYRIHGPLADIKVDEISKKNTKVKVELPEETLQDQKLQNETMPEEKIPSEEQLIDNKQNNQSFEQESLRQADELIDVTLPTESTELIIPN